MANDLLDKERVPIGALDDPVMKRSGQISD